jgi:hypothetical protein
MAELLDGLQSVVAASAGLLLGSTLHRGEARRWQRVATKARADADQATQQERHAREGEKSARAQEQVARHKAMIGGELATVVREPTQTAPGSGHGSGLGSVKAVAGPSGRPTRTFGDFDLDPDPDAEPAPYTDAEKMAVLRRLADMYFREEG